MKKRIVFIIISLFSLNSCFYNKINKYPLNSVNLNNYENINFKYTKIKTINYEFCMKSYFIFFFSEIQDWANINIFAIQKFKENYVLKEDEYLVNIENKQGKTAIFPPFFMKNCRNIEMDLVKKINEAEND